MAGVKILQADFHRSWVPGDEKLLHRPQIAFAGRSNVGKSSMINALLHRKNLAQKSKTPGKTRKVNFFEVKYTLSSQSPSLLYFVDLPGYGFARVSQKERRKWETLLTTYFEKSEGLRLTILIVDARIGITPLDQHFIDWYQNFGKPLLLALNKCDKLKQSERQRLQNQLSSSAPAILTSSTKHFNIHKIWSEILSSL